MKPDERLFADYTSTGLTIGMHPMRSASRTHEWPGRDPCLGARTHSRRRAGPHRRSVICRQRPGTAKGFLFVSLEDETGIANAIVLPDLFTAQRLTIVEEPFLLIEGILQNQRGSVSVKASRVEALRVDAAAGVSHDFH